MKRFTVLVVALLGFSGVAEGGEKVSVLILDELTRFLLLGFAPPEAFYCESCHLIERIFLTKVLKGLALFF